MIATHPIGRNRWMSILAVPCLLLFLTACQSGALSEKNEGAEPFNASALGPLATYQDQVTVLLMGKAGCPGTEKGTEVLTGYNRSKPDGVSIVRLEVPPPGKKLGKPEGWNAGFPCEVDVDRKVAEQFDFFYYPTLFIIDRGGHVRYRGGCEGEEIMAIVQEILVEEPGDPKKIFTAPKPAVGQPAAAFSGTTIDGAKASISDLRGDAATLVVFSSLTCPFSRKAVECLPGIRSSFASKGASVIVVNEGGTLESIRPFYTSKVPGVPVIVDSEREIGVDMYGVQTVPFFYVMDDEGRIALMGPFTETAARGSLNNVLGISKEPVRIEKSGAG